MLGPLRLIPFWVPSRAPFRVPLLALAFGFGLTPRPLPAATGSQTTYLKFEKGSEAKASNVARVEETLEIDSIGLTKKSHWYLMRGLSGQRVTLRLQGEPGTQVLFSCPGSQGYAEVRETPWTFELPESGDYLLRLEADGAKAGSTYQANLEVELFTRRRDVPPSASGLYGRNGGEDSMIDVAQEEDGSLRFYLYAFWKGGQMPEIAGRVPFEMGAASYKDGDCTLTFQFKDGSLDLQGTGTCPQGYTEAIFGTYPRTSRCGWPRTPGR